MTAVLLDGKKVSQIILDRCAQRVKAFVARTGVVPCLAAVLVGDDPASATYVKMKGKRCTDVGMKPLPVLLPRETTTAQLVARIRQLGEDPAVHGILLQLPVPKHIDTWAACEAIPIEKDVDGVTVRSFGATALKVPGQGFPCCTPAGIMALMKEYKVEVRGKHAVVVGRGPILGKPMAMMLLNADATVTVCHRQTPDLAEVVGQGDIVVAATSEPRTIKGEWIKPGAVVIDAVYAAGNVGGVNFAPAAARAAYITPIPGGVGPMTIAMLIDQTATAAERSVKS